MRGMDTGFEFEDLGNAIRKCQVDLGVTIDIDTRPIRPDPVTGRALAHCAVGTIRYGGAGRAADRMQAPDGYLLYIKPTITGSEPGDVLQYRAAHAEFPHESTSDQWFGESQFESYRKLGHHIARLVFRGAGVAAPRGAVATTHPGRERMFVALKERWYPSSAAVKAAFSRHADRLNTLQVALRRDESLHFLDSQIYPEWDELMRGRAAPRPPSLSLPDSFEEARAGFYFCVNLLQLMQSVYLDLNLEEEHDHPDNRGWMNLFKHWSWATMLRATYAICCSTFGARFQTFCARRLDLEPGRPQVVSRPVAGAVDGVLEEARKRNELNFYELELIRRCAAARVPFDEVHLLRLRVDDPSRAIADPAAAPALEFTFGFALTHRQQFVYFRVQDHLRRMGLARDALRKLCEGDRYAAVSERAWVRHRPGRVAPLPGASQLGAQRGTGRPRVIRRRAADCLIAPRRAFRGVRSNGPILSDRAGGVAAGEHAVAQRRQEAVAGEVPAGSVAREPRRDAATRVEVRHRPPVGPEDAGRPVDPEPALRVEQSAGDLHAAKGRLQPTAIAPAERVGPVRVGGGAILGERLGKCPRREPERGGELRGAPGGDHRSRVQRLPVVLESERELVETLVVHVPREALGLGQHPERVLGVARGLVAEPTAVPVHLDAALGDHRVGDEDAVRYRDRGVRLVGVHEGDRAAERLAPPDGLARVALAAEVVRAGHLRAVAREHRPVGGEPVRGQDHLASADFARRGRPARSPRRAPRRCRPRSDR